MASHLKYAAEVASKTQIRKAGAALRDFRASGINAEDLEPEELSALTAAVDIVADYRASFSQPLLSVRMSATSFARTCGYGEEAMIAQRLKRLPRIISKLDRIRTMNITTMGDIGGCRVIVPTIEAQSAIRKHMEKQWGDTIRDLKDYVSAPKPDGYRAVHVEVVRSDRRIEVQLRTQRQHRWADSVERISRRLGVELKWGQGDERHEVREFLLNWAEALALLDQGAEVPGEMRDQLQDFLGSTDQLGL